MSLSLNLKSIIIKAFTNADGSHSQYVSHHERTEGFTELFGNKSVEKSSKNENVVTDDIIWKLDDYYVFR